MSQLWRQVSRAQGLMRRFPTWSTGGESVRRGRYTHTHTRSQWEKEQGRDRCRRRCWRRCDSHSAGDCSPQAYNWEIIAQFSATDTQSILEPISISYQEHAPGTVNVISFMSRKTGTQVEGGANITRHCVVCFCREDRLTSRIGSASANLPSPRSNRQATWHTWRHKWTLENRK